MASTIQGRPFDLRAEADMPPQPGERLPQPTAPTPRQLARDATTGRIGEVMPHPIPERLCDRRSPSAMRLRPIGGGCEWTTRAAYLVDTAGRCLRCADTHTVTVDIVLADAVVSDPRPCPDCAVTA